MAKAPEGSQVLVRFRRSSDPSKYWHVSQTPDGGLHCECLGYVFSKTTPKGCKHITIVRERGMDVAEAFGDTIKLKAMRQALVKGVKEVSYLSDDETLARFCAALVREGFMKPEPVEPGPKTPRITRMITLDED